MIELVHLPVRRGNAPLRIARGHFATNHSHINYYIDITYQKTRLSEAKDSACQLVSHFVNDTPVDTVLCLDGTAVPSRHSTVSTGVSFTKWDTSWQALSLASLSRVF